MSKRFIWTDDLLQVAANPYSKRQEFRLGNRNAYNAAKRKGRAFLDKICGHMAPSHNIAWSEEEMAAEALKYASRKDFVKNNSLAYEAAWRKGGDFLSNICSHMDVLWRPYTDEEVGEESKKYTSRYDFLAGSPGQYRAALRKGSKFFIHMGPSLREMWLDEEISVEALKYTSRGNFREMDPSAYQAASKRGRIFLDLLCSHMRRSGGISSFEKELLSRVKSYCSDVRSIRDMKVKIEGRPHIHGFDIDIFSGLLMKGIEFDGTYHHSFKGLKRGRKHWPDEDIRNYHDLKDKWFETKGIQILHITEKEWKANKEDCVQRCLEFLNITNPLHENDKVA